MTNELWLNKGLEREAFIERVWIEGATHYRELPWRHIDDPYAVLVSEIMLQQTQVARVEKFWRRFLTMFPAVDALAAASTSDVLEQWQGLGYNRRALALKRAADICSAEYNGQLPQTYDELIALPGIGPATAAGVMAFAWQQPGVYLETNVRAVFIHELFPDKEKVSDRELIPLVADVCPERLLGAEPGGLRSEASQPSLRPPSSALHDCQSPRDWYYALLDYGAHLKSTGVNPTRRSATYAKQSTFEGSRRQKRSWIVRRVLAAENGVLCEEVFADLNATELKAGRTAVDAEIYQSILNDLIAEGFFRRNGDMLLPQ